MNTVTISPHFQAYNLFRQYRAALAKTHSAEDEALMNGYRALSKGRHVLDLYGSMTKAGRDAQGRPRLAIVRADAERVWCTVERLGAALFSHNDSRFGVKIPTRTLPWNDNQIRCHARVPLIPPVYRPRSDLKNYYLLWEAEWVSAPKDPILLRPLGKNLYAVMAQWDLTPLEQAILMARGNQ